MLGTTVWAGTLVLTAFIGVTVNGNQAVRVVSDITIGGTIPMPASRASTPNEAPNRAAAIAI